MKKVLCQALAAGLILSAGCSKKEEPAPNPPAAPETTLTEQAQAISKDLTKKAEATTRNVAQKIEAVKSALPVKPDQILAELNQPVADIKANVATMGQPELMAYANAYKDVIVANKDKLAGLTSSLKGLPMADLLGEKGIAIKNQLSQYTAQIAGLKERYGVYLDKLKALGVDLSAFGL
jgi:hypothetical protein